LHFCQLGDVCSMELSKNRNAIVATIAINDSLPLLSRNDLELDMRYIEVMCLRLEMISLMIFSCLTLH
jgi:hypothetical protein